MTNELYKGNYIHEKRTKKPMYYENVVETIISKQKWEDCQYQKQRNARHYERTATYLFTNKLKCAKCGRFLGGCATTKKNGNKYYYYKCEHCKTYFSEIDIEEQLKTSKPTLTGKEVKIDKETYDTLKDFMNTSKRVIKDMPNNQALFEELNNYTNHYREMEQKNRHLEVEIKRLEYKNDELRDENKILHNFLNVMLQTKVL